MMMPGVVASQQPTVAAAGEGISYIGTTVGRSADSLVLSLPSGLQEGDIVLVGWTNGTSGTPNTISGWESLVFRSGSPALRIYYKVMGATPDETITLPDLSGTNVSVGMARAYRGCSPNIIFDADTTTFVGATDDPDSPAITTATDGAMVIAWGFLDDDAATSVTFPSGYANGEWYASSDTLQTANHCTTMACDKLVESAGTENPGAFVTDGFDVNAAYTIALKPYPTSGTEYYALSNRILDGSTANTSNRVGYSFTVGGADLSVNSLRAIIAIANIEDVSLHRNSDNALLAQANLVLEANVAKHAIVPEIILEAGQSYTISARDTGNQSRTVREGDTVTVHSGITIDGYVSEATSGRPTASTATEYNFCDFGWLP